jgi:hypothetical protein
MGQPSSTRNVACRPNTRNVCGAAIIHPNPTALIDVDSQILKT